MDLSSVADTAVWLSKVSFGAFVVLAIIDVILKIMKHDVVPKAVAMAATAEGPQIDPSKILEAAAKLAEAMAKAGPALSALIASLVFLAIAGLCAGAKPVVDKTGSCCGADKTAACCPPSAGEKKAPPAAPPSQSTPPT
jgi:hypothetical protein